MTVSAYKVAHRCILLRDYFFLSGEKNFTWIFYKIININI